MSLDIDQFEPIELLDDLRGNEEINQAQKTDIKGYFNVRAGKGQPEGGLCILLRQDPNTSLT